MSGQQTVIKVGVTCVVIVLGAVFVGSQLSTGDSSRSLISKAAEEDEAGMVESADSDDAEAQRSGRRDRRS